MTVPLQFYFCFQIFPIFVAEEKYFHGKTNNNINKFQTYLPIFFSKGYLKHNFC